MARPNDLFYFQFLHWWQKQIGIKKRKFEKKLLKIWKTFINISKPQNWKNTMGRLKGWFCQKKKVAQSHSIFLYLEEKRFQMVIFRHKFLRFKHNRFIFYSALGASHMCNQICLRLGSARICSYLTQPPSSHNWKKKSWTWFRDPKKGKTKTKNANFYKFWILSSLTPFHIAASSHDFWEWNPPCYLLHVVFWHGYFCIDLVCRSLFCVQSSSLCRNLLQ